MEWPVVVVLPASSVASLCWSQRKTTSE